MASQELETFIQEIRQRGVAVLLREKESSQDLKDLSINILKNTDDTLAQFFSKLDYKKVPTVTLESKQNEMQKNELILDEDPIHKSIDGTKSKQTVFDDVTQTLFVWNIDDDYCTKTIHGGSVGKYCFEGWTDFRIVKSSPHCSWIDLFHKKSTGDYASVLILNEKVEQIANTLMQWRREYYERKCKLTQ